MQSDILEEFGMIDIYLFDQLQKGRFDDCKTILDAGCGYGRNLHYFLKNGYEVFGVDTNPEGIEAITELARQLSPGTPVSNFEVVEIENIKFHKVVFDVVICSAVLHFAKDHVQFKKMLTAMWRPLKPGGYFFARLSSSIGIADSVVNLGNGRHRLPDNSERYLVDYKTLHDLTDELNGELFEPIKTTNVQDLRAMTTWCVKKK